MIPLLLLALAAFGVAVLYPRRPSRDWSRGYRELRDAALQAETSAAIWRRQAERGKPATSAARDKVISLERQRKA